MSKAHRGSGIRSEANHGRGKCARCGKEDIKVLYEKEIDGANVKVCKYCNAALKNIARVEARKAKAAAPAAEEAPAEAPATEEAQAWFCLSTPSYNARAALFF